MTTRKYSYTHGDGTAHRRVSDEMLFCLDRPHSEFENEFSPIIWRVGAANDSELVASIWHRHRKDAEHDFVKANPGQRPTLWWSYTWPQLHPGVEVPDDIGALSKDRTTEQCHAQELFLHRYDLLTTGERRALPKRSRVVVPKLRVLEGGATDAN